MAYAFFWGLGLTFTIFANFASNLIRLDRAQPAWQVLRVNSASACQLHRAIGEDMALRSLATRRRGRMANARRTVFYETLDTAANDDSSA